MSSQEQEKELDKLEFLTEYDSEQEELNMINNNSLLIIKSSIKKIPGSINLFKYKQNVIFDSKIARIIIIGLFEKENPAFKGYLAYISDQQVQVSCTDEKELKEFLYFINDKQKRLMIKGIQLQLETSN